MDPFIGEIDMFAGSFAPRGWAFCNGQRLSISVYTALFSILGTTYGGDGRTTFAVPDLRSRCSVHPGTGPGLSGVNLGQRAGTEQNTITVNQLAAHNHLMACTTALGDKDLPAGNIPAAEAADASLWSDATPNGTMNANMIQNTGGGLPYDNREPYLGMNYIIALEGVYPSRN